MLLHCPASARTCGKVAVARGFARQSRLVVKGYLKEASPPHVADARAWIEGWKFKQLKVASLEEGIAKAADYLEDTKEVRNAKKKTEEAMLKRTVKVSFKVKKPVKYGNSLKLVGSAPEMGAWTPAKAAPMKWSDGDLWTLDLNMKAGSYEFKVVTYADNGESEWEQGDNRIVKVPLAAEDGTSMSVELKAAVEEKAKEVAAKQ